MRFLYWGRSKPRRLSAIFILLVAIVLFAQVSQAQRQGDNNAPTTTEDTKTADPATTESVTTTDKSKSDSKTTDSTTTTEESTTTDAATTSTDSETSATDSATTSTGSTASDGFPIATVPPTADAPYMKKSNIPEGTVFIAVGGALGLIGLSVLAWRAIVAWSVNRSVRRAALQYASEKKSLIRNKRKRSSRHSRIPTADMSLEKLPPHYRSSFNPRASQVPSTGSGLFFSPTAGAGMHNPGNRGSSYLPAGYYAAGNATPGGSGAMPSTPGELQPNSQGYIRTKSNPSPPGSPGLSPGPRDTQYSNHARHSYIGGSTSSLNLTSPPQGRTPSAFLEDLFENHAPQSSDTSHR